MPVARVSETPPTLNVVVAWMSTDPGVEVLMGDPEATGALHPPTVCRPGPLGPSEQV